MDFPIDNSLVSRLLFGALSEHEQRILVAKLARSDPEFRASLRSVLELFETFDSDLVAEYAAVLERAPRDVDQKRRKILDRSYARADDLEALIQEFTVTDALALGDVTRQFFSWSMAELLLQRSLDSMADVHRARTSSYLALMVIDVVEILGAVGRTPHFADVVADVRQRIRQAAETSGAGGSPAS